MKKILKIKFVKFEKALAMQILEQVGKFKDGKLVKIGYTPVLAEDCLCLRGRESEQDNSLSCIDFSTNTERDEYLDKVVKWISEEQFATSGKLEVGKMCEVSDDNKCWLRRTLLAVLPKSFFSKYIAAEAYSDNKWCSWKYARPIASCVQPKIDGDVYTWEMEVSE